MLFPGQARFEANESNRPKTIPQFELMIKDFYRYPVVNCSWNRLWKRGKILFFDLDLRVAEIIIPSCLSFGPAAALFRSVNMLAVIKDEIKIKIKSKSKKTAF
jgi:hypothetical protein